MAGMSLWGESFDIAPEPQKQKKLIEKVAKPQKVKTATEKVIKSKSSSVYTMFHLDRMDIFRGVHFLSHCYFKRKSQAG